MKKFFSEFKTFAMRGNVIDLAVGVVVGGAFGSITTSLVNDIIMPIVSLLTGGVNFSSWKWVLKAATADAEEIAVHYGNLLAAVIDFLIIAFVIFCVVKGLNSLHRKKEEAPAAPPAPSAEEKLLTEIRDLLKERQ
ncbi:MAG: large-conductance mechanosensitive channel protein MscL [Oscillospiraceae bacterium]